MAMGEGTSKVGVVLTKWPLFVLYIIIYREMAYQTTTTRERDSLETETICIIAN